MLQSTISWSYRRPYLTYLLMIGPSDVQLGISDIHPALRRGGGKPRIL